jgi:hypothetical protein
MRLQEGQKAPSVMHGTTLREVRHHFFILSTNVP